MKADKVVEAHRIYLKVQRAILYFISVVTKQAAVWAAPVKSFTIGRISLPEAVVTLISICKDL